MPCIKVIAPKEFHALAISNRLWAQSHKSNSLAQALDSIV